MRYEIYDGLGIFYKDTDDLEYAKSLAIEVHGHVMDEGGNVVFDAADELAPAYELIIEVTAQIPAGVGSMSPEDMGAVADDAAAEVSRWFSDRAEDLGGPVEVFRTVRVA